MLATLLHQAPAATSPAPAPSVSPSPTPEASAVPPLPFTDWRRRVLAAHNVIVVGNPQSGKSTLTRAFLPALAKLGDICILDPHGTRNRWPWQAIGSGRDYVAIAHALDLLADELDQRYQQPAALRRLSIIIDEVPSITLHQKQPWERTYPQLVFEGAKADMRTWILAQSAQVEPLGLKGKGDLRTSLTWLYLGEQAIAQCAACAAQPYPAALEQRGVVLPIDTTPLAVYARLPVDEHAQWMVPPAAHGSAPVQSAEPHPNAVQPGSAVPPEPAEPAHQAATDALNLNLDDLRKLAHALRLYAGGSGKVKAIEQAFRCRKGGGSVYQRAHWLVTQALAEQRSTASDDDPDDPPGAFGFLNQ
jgi:hypothetical protein